MNVLGVRKFINSCNKKLQVMIKLINSLINALFIDTINCVNKNWKVFIFILLVMFETTVCRRIYL